MSVSKYRLSFGCCCCERVSESCGVILTKVTPNSPKAAQSSDENWYSVHATFLLYQTFSEEFQNMNFHLSLISCEVCEFELLFIF